MIECQNILYLCKKCAKIGSLRYNRIFLDSLLTRIILFHNIIKRIK